MKRTKLIMSIITCCFALSVLAFGVYASLSVNFNLSGKITFDPNGVDAHIETQVFKYNQEITHDDAYLLASEVQANTIDDFNSDVDYIAFGDKHEYSTKNGNVYDVEHEISGLQFDFEDCYAYVIVIHVNPNNDSYDLEAHNQIVFGELKTNTEFPDGAWLAYNDKYLVIYPSAQDEGLNMILVVGVEQFKEVAETDFTLTLTLSYKDIYVPEDDEIREDLYWDDAGSNDILIRIFSGTCEDGDDFDEIVLPETVEYNGTKNVVGIQNEDGELYGKKLILNKNCVIINVRDENNNYLGVDYADQTIKDYIIVDQRNEKISSLDNMLFNKDKSILMLASDSHTNYIVPSFVEEINHGAFDFCVNLEKVIISKGVTSIGDGAFWGCTLLTRIIIPHSVTSIGDGAFWGCTLLTRITIPDSVTSIGDYAFCSCSSLTNITLPDSVTSIGEYAFKGCNESIFTIDTTYGGKYIKSKSNEYFALVDYDDTVNTEFILNKNCNVIGESVCERSKITSFDFNGANIKEIPYNMFDHCSSLTSITIPDSVTSIGDTAFSYCSSLTDITIPDSVTSIGDAAFYVTNLSSIYIPASVQTMGYDVFEDIKNSNFKIYCGATQQPDGWDGNWNRKDYDGNKWTDITWGITRERYNEIVNG